MFHSATKARLIHSKASCRRFAEKILSKRSFADSSGIPKAKTPQDFPPPPPPPPPDSTPSRSVLNSLGKVLLCVGGLSGVYYYRDEISKLADFGEKTSSKIVDKDGLSVDSLRQEVEKIGSSIEKNSKRLTSVGANQPNYKNESVPASASAESKEFSEKSPNAGEKTSVSSRISLVAQKQGKVDYNAVREAIADILSDDDYDDGSIGPVLVRLAWHNAGTFNKNTKQGGSEGACMRFENENEASWGANAGLGEARARLEPIKKQFPEITYSDLWSLAGTVALEEMGGPTFKWRPGRNDFTTEANNLPDGLLPDADGRGNASLADHLREIFYRMGFNDREIVCLSGAHALGRCHTQHSGYWGPWTRSPTTFSNEFYRLLLEETWSKKTTHEGKRWTGPLQYENSQSGADLVMLETDYCLVEDAAMKPFVELYAKDEELFMADFAAAWIKLQELGVRKFCGWRRYYIFGPRE